MPALSPLPPTYVVDRPLVQLMAVHALARARFQAVGRFGLVPTPGGFGTPAFGPDATVVRLTPSSLLVDGGGDTAVTPLAGITLTSIAEAAGTSLDTEFSTGADTPPYDDPDGLLAVAPATVAAIGTWFALGWAAIDAAVADLGPAATPARTQIWPEHFDAGTSVAVGPGEGERANLGASPGDAGHPEPYLYVGPWGPDRPGDPAYWNAPFGAVLGHDDLLEAEDPQAAAVTFLVTGLRYLATWPEP